MPQLHHLAGLDDERGDAIRGNQRHQCLDAVSNRDTVLVELFSQSRQFISARRSSISGVKRFARAPSWVKARTILLSLTMTASSWVDDG